MKHEEFDAVIVGAGITGNFLAKQLISKNKNIKIAVIEKDETSKRRIGESSSDFTGIILNSFYNKEILSEQKRKTGLSFIFQNDQNFLSPSQASIANGYQLDRSTFDKKITDQNQELGIKYLFSSKITEIKKESAFNYLLTIRKQDNIRTIKTSWLIDCTGKNRFLHKYYELPDLETNHSISSTWCYVRHEDVELNLCQKYWDKIAIGPQTDSTMHFMGHGYWWWLFPINSEVYSLGLVYENSYFPIKKPREIFDLVKSSDKNISKVITFEKNLKIYHLNKVAYLTKEQLTDGELILGDAYGFSDPFLSGGIEFSLQHCLYYSDLISKNLSNQHISTKKWKNADSLFRDSMNSRFFLFRDRYKVFDDSDITSLWLQFDFIGYIVRYIIPTVALSPSFLKYPIRLNFIERYFYQKFKNRLFKLYKTRKRYSLPNTYPRITYSYVVAPKNKLKALMASVILIFLFVKNYLRLEIATYKNKLNHDDNQVVAE